MCPEILNSGQNILMNLKKIKKAIDTYIAEIKPEFISRYYLKNKMDYLVATSGKHAESILKWRDGLHEFQIALLFVFTVFAPDENKEFPVDNIGFKNLLALARQEITLRGVIKKSADGEFTKLIFTNPHKAFYQQLLVQKHINLVLLVEHVDGIYNLERDDNDINLAELNESVTNLSEEFSRLRKLLAMLTRELTISVLQHNHHHHSILNTFYDCFCYFESTLIDLAAPLFMNNAEYYRGKEVVCKIAENKAINPEFRKKTVLKFFEDLLIFQFFIYKSFNIFFNYSVAEPHKGFIAEEITHLFKLPEINTGSINHYANPSFVPLMPETKSELQETAAAIEAKIKKNQEIMRQEKVIHKYVIIDEFYEKIDEILSTKDEDLKDNLLGTIHWQLKFNMDCLLYIKNSYANDLAIYEASEISIRVDHFFKPKPEVIVLQPEPVSCSNESRFIQTKNPVTGKPVFTRKNVTAVIADAKSAINVAEAIKSPDAKSESATAPTANNFRESLIPSYSSALINKNAFDEIYKPLMRKIAEFENLYGVVTTHPLYNMTDPNPKKDRMKDSAKVRTVYEKYHAAITKKVDALKLKMDALIVTEETEETILTRAKDYFNQISSMDTVANNLYKEIHTIYNSFIKTQANIRNKTVKTKSTVATSVNIVTTSTAPSVSGIIPAAEENTLTDIEPETFSLTQTVETTSHTLTITLPPETEGSFIDVLPSNPAKISFVKFTTAARETQRPVDLNKRNVRFDKRAGRFNVKFSAEVIIIPEPVYQDDEPKMEPLSARSLQIADDISLAKFQHGIITDTEKQLASTTTEWCQTIGCFFKKARHVFTPDEQGIGLTTTCPKPWL
jgi:hypothetical protein